MDTTESNMTNLFLQLGLPAEKAEIAAFIRGHQLAEDVRVSEAPYWNDGQRQFLREQLVVDADWAIIVTYLAFTAAIGYYYYRQDKVNKNTGDFFLGGRNLPWYIAGISMVATTFAADTPLAVTGLVAKHGISGNWLWWNMLAGGMLTTFFFARLWRRSGVITEVELIELRYSGPEAAFLRGLGVGKSLAVICRALVRPMPWM